MRLSFSEIFFLVSFIVMTAGIRIDSLIDSCHTGTQRDCVCLKLKARCKTMSVFFGSCSKLNAVVSTAGSHSFSYKERQSL